MRKSALVIRHVHFEDLGTFAPVLTQLGYDIAYVNAPTDDLFLASCQPADLLVVLGGPIGVYEIESYPFLNPEIDMIRERLLARRPTLGICLGAQLMAAALRSPVYPGPAKEIGWFPLLLTAEGQSGPLRHLADTVMLHWHGDTFDLPPNATRLASTEICANQAFAIGNHALAFQFHPEVDADRIEYWLVGHAAEIAAARLSVTELRANAKKFGRALKSSGQACIEEWLSGFSVHK
jgi:GMP synthase (glutamine-hydrolysing)